MAETYVAFCRVCEQVRYKSSRPLEAKEKPKETQEETVSDPEKKSE